MVVKLRRSLMLGLVSFVMAVAVLIASPATANAFAVPPAPVIEAGLSEEGIAAVAEGLSLAGPPGWIAAGAVLAGGTLLYATQDTWLPWATNLFSSGDPAPPGQVNTGDYCIFDVRVDHTNASGVVFTDDGSVPGSDALAGSNGSYCSYAGPSFTWEAQCITPDGNFLQQGSGVSTGWGGGVGQTAISNDTLCQHPGANTGNRPISLSWYQPETDPRHWVTNPFTWKSPDVADQSLLEANRQVTSDKLCQDSHGVMTTVTRTYVGIGGIPAGACPSGTSPYEVKVTTGTQGGIQSPAMDIKPDPASAEETAHPLCYVPGGAACKLSMTLDGSQRCGYTAGLLSYAPCSHWWDLDPSRVLCQFGPYVVPRTDCLILKEAYHTGYVTLSPATQDWIPANPNGTPWIAPAPNPAPTATATPQPSQTPSTEPSPTPDPQPTPTATTSATPVLPPNPTATATADPTATGTATPAPTGAPTGTGSGQPTRTGTAAPTTAGTVAPTGPVSPAPSTAPTAPPVPGPGDQGAPKPGADGGECFPSGWSAFNPLEWVYQPVKCALSWAFVPPAGSLNDSFASVRSAWNDSGPGKWSGYLGSAISAGGNAAGSGGGSCEGPAMTIGATKFTPSETMHPLNACSSPMSTIASIVKTVLTIGLWFGAFFVSARAILGAMGIKVMDAFRSDKE